MHRARILILVALLAGLAPAPAGQAQGSTRTFPETGHTVRGLFWQYWQGHGGLAQQGFPLSEELPEKSDLNGRTYIVQYFERAVFEQHPENAPPFSVLVAQLGTLRYRAKYPAGAPGQHADPVSPRLFPETKHTLGGAFRTYWETHGGLAQQGLPISDEFVEVSDLNGKPYLVQYFERAVLELHPENPARYRVLLSQLGTLRYRARYGGAPPTAVPPTAVPPPPTAGARDCAGLPADQGVTVTPRCFNPGSSFTFTAHGLRPGETVVVHFTNPSGADDPYSIQKIVDETGTVCCPQRFASPDIDLGVWTVRVTGESGDRALGYFKVIP